MTAAVCMWRNFPKPCSAQVAERKRKRLISFLLFSRPIRVNVHKNTTGAAEPGSRRNNVHFL